jgi:putative Holliday junction resolvase
VHSSQTLEAVGKLTAPPRRLIAIDLGAKRVGVAVSDELQITVTPLERIERRSWKDLLRRVAALIDDYDARALVIGLPLSLDGNENNAAQDAQRIAENFRKSLSVPVFLQDERLTTAAAESELRSRGAKASEVAKRIDSESAAIILRDFIAAKPDAEGAMDLECGGKR